MSSACSRRRRQRPDRPTGGAAPVRYGLLDGVAFVALSAISFLVTGAPPARDAEAGEIARYFVDNRSGIKLGAILFGIALIFGLMWLGSL